MAGLHQRWLGAMFALLFFVRVQAQTPQYKVFKPGDKTTDQSTTVNPNAFPPFPAGDPYHSGLAVFAGRVVWDVDLATIYMGLPALPPAVWVFGQCYGGGMLDDLNKVGGVQSGISASNFDEKAYYPAIGGNGTDFLFAYLHAMASTRVTPQILATKASYNDPFGPSPNPFPARTVEPVPPPPAEQSIYLSTAAAADNLRLANAFGVAALWAGVPQNEDAQQLAQAIQLLRGYGYSPVNNIYVLIGNGLIPKNPIDPLYQAVVGGPGAPAIPPTHVLAATEANLTTAMTNLAMGLPPVLFFFAADHGVSTQFGGTADIKIGNGGGGYAQPANCYEGYGGYGTPYGQSTPCP